MINTLSASILLNSYHQAGEVECLEYEVRNNLGLDFYQQQELMALISEGNTSVEFFNNFLTN